MAVVRGCSDKAAYLRLRAGCNSGDPELLQLFDDLARKHLRVYAGEQQRLSRALQDAMSGIMGPCLLIRLCRGCHAVA